MRQLRSPLFGIAKIGRGFTLIELLIVIAIMAILLSLLIPVAGIVRYQSRETACASNLRQIGALLTAYANDNGGWYPKNGAIRNNAYSLKNGTTWDITIPLQGYTKKLGTDIWRCPLVLPKMIDTTTQTSYALMFDVWGYQTSPTAVIGWSSKPTTDSSGNGLAPGSVPWRPMQFNINGSPIWNAASPSSVVATTSVPFLDELKLMRKVGQNWTARISNTNMTFNMLAGDRMQGRGHPVYSRESNHPDPSEQWRITGAFWTGVRQPSNASPKTSANYLSVDGSVVRQNFRHVDYWPPPPQPELVGIPTVGSIPIQFQVK